MAVRSNKSILFLRFRRAERTDRNPAGAEVAPENPGSRIVEDESADRSADENVAVGVQMTNFCPVFRSENASRTEFNVMLVFFELIY